MIYLFGFYLLFNLIIILKDLGKNIKLVFIKYKRRLIKRFKREDKHEESQYSEESQESDKKEEGKNNKEESDKKS